MLAPQVGLEPTTLRLTAECSAIELLRNMAVVVQFLLYNHLLESGSDLLSRAVSSQVPSARGGLTSVFGMGTGGTLQPLPPEILCRFQFPRRLASSRFAPRFPLRAPSRFPLFASPRYLPLSRGLRFPSDAPLSLRFRPSGPLFRTFKTAQVKLTSKHLLHLFFLIRSSPRPISTGKLSRYRVYTAGLSTLSSSRGLTYL